ncbi:hypothetical protein SAMN05421676_107107 [Salinibacillus kushneri]|uniref:Uncharacterized protein n=1 Tax=Salinibacillus kushneri TaxID=237682 RepID=A0A1I0GRU1_9BACI|nr:YtxH domain-containing protein [Salinibacillus kushneri]SET73117.1 hypothetical protein SAMN05421676_107107 [Salinibacillus kushneri]
MKQNRWKRGVLIGATLGALCSLFHRETREGAKEFGRDVLGQIRSYREDPAKAFEVLRTTVEEIEYYADSIIKQLDDADNMIEKRPKQG